MTSKGEPAPSAPAATGGGRGRRPRRWREVSATRRGLVLAWWAFTVTFGGLRLLTWLIHIDAAGVGNVSAGGVHIHHYVWGILLLMIVGACGLVERTARWRTWMGLAYGVGLALVIDEAASLIDLKDVYWDRAGGTSIAIALLIIGVAGSALALTHRDSAPSTDPH
ncbi:hypothetical protein [Streptacidiphilus sp. P02-A3a]|uniref:hypothetical protein n=1 Tax=Streptacidiphilus sp. P02-A3a TaxID=2704468 RepID=UPI0015FA650C|nr:hypothetical protein [Streptacidiphilus sp. P02-A3a]QMU69639.1 hypothetical protein GXP74_16735 [Streptacidiphilus sp. P02-A3a]